MKKLLSLVLAVIMLLSIMPTAYAQRATYSPEIEEYIEDYIKAVAYFRNIYATPEQKLEVRSIIREAFDENTDISPVYDNLANIEADGRLEELTAFHEVLKKVIDEVEEKISAGEFVIVLDTYEVTKYSCYCEIYYSYEDLAAINDRTENFKSDKYIEVWNEAQIGIDIVYPILNGLGEGPLSTKLTQAEFDAALEMAKPLYNLYVACLDGNHPYGEYISDNNATEEVDGTKTATCEFCGATDTIVDEGTKLPKKEASFFDIIFALIKELFAKIFSIFG